MFSTESSGLCASFFFLSLGKRGGKEAGEGTAAYSSYNVIDNGNQLTRGPVDLNMNINYKL